MGTPQMRGCDIASVQAPGPVLASLPFFRASSVYRFPHLIRDTHEGTERKLNNLTILLPITCSHFRQERTSLTRLTWSKICSVKVLATLADVRDFMQSYLSPDHLENDTWQRVTNCLRGTRGSNNLGDVVISTPNAVTALKLRRLFRSCGAIRS
jgi:hypothetical protein